MLKNNYFLWCFVALLFAFFIELPLLAQPAGRILFNSDFEIPILTPTSPAPPRQSCNPATACWYLVPENLVPGWNVVDDMTTSTDIINDNVEFWNSGFNGVPAQTGNGNQFIELNADRRTSVFFEICMFMGETLTWSLWHRGRNGTDVMSLNITSAAGASLFSQNISTGNTAWVNYTGMVMNTGPNGAVRFTFTPVTSVGGLTFGNFIDNVQVLGLSPLVEFASASYSAVESTVSPPRLLVNGTIPVGGATVTLTTTGGTATGGGTDYTYNTTVNIPAGNYDGTLATSIPITLSIVEDALVEVGGETINFFIAGATAPLLVNDANCNGSIQNATVYNIIDNDLLLPVTLTSFSAKVLSTQVQLGWQTSMEMQSAYFEIQHSPNGIDWHTIGQVEAQQNSNTLHQYSFLDTSPQNRNYYRLKMIDIDSTYQYSKIVSANLNSIQANQVLIYPNPVGKNESLKIVLTTMAENISVELNDVLGRTHVKYTSNYNTDAITINIPNITGIYFVVISCDGKLIQRKLTVQ